MGLFDFFKTKDDPKRSYPKNKNEVWIRDTYAIWAESSYQSFKYIGGCIHDNKTKKAVQYLLKKDWGISNAQHCFDMSKYLQKAENLDELAWNLCRATQVLALGFVADYYDRETMNKASVVIAVIMQKNYKSWEDMVSHYVAGYLAWTKENFGGDWTTAAQTRKSALITITSDSEPAFKIPWRLDFRKVNPFDTQEVEDETPPVQVDKSDIDHMLEEINGSGFWVNDEEDQDLDSDLDDTEVVSKDDMAEFGVVGSNLPEKEADADVIEDLEDENLPDDDFESSDVEDKELPNKESDDVAKDEDLPRKTQVKSEIVIDDEPDPEEIAQMLKDISGEPEEEEVQEENLTDENKDDVIEESDKEQEEDEPEGEKKLAPLEAKPEEIVQLLKDLEGEDPEDDEK